MALEFKELLDYCQVEAINNKAGPTEDSVWRSIARTYSKLFNTPLHVVLNDLVPEEVILNVYEYQLDNLDINKFENLQELYEIVCKIEDPNYETKVEEELDEFVEQAEREEEERVKYGKSIPGVSKKTLLGKKEPETEKLPTQGSINLEYLAKLDGEEN